MKKTILFRADGNASTGLGHLYRLFSLVETVKLQFEFVYVTREDSILSVIPKSYSVELIPNHISVNEESKWLTEHYLPEKHIVIADGYQFTSDYQKALKKCGFGLIYIDDLTTEHMFADVVINHSPQIKTEDFNKEVYTQLALGTDYALLRPLFLASAKKVSSLKKLDTAFVNFGGADQYNLTELALSALLKMPSVKKINIVLGAAYQHEIIFELEKLYPNKIFIHRNLSEANLLKLMQSCSFAIVPSSTILFELFCVKLPVFSGYFVDNQKEAYFYFRENELVSGYGDFKELTQDSWYENLLEFVNLPSHEKALKKQEIMIDGKQQSRFIKLIKDII